MHESYAFGIREFSDPRDPRLVHRPEPLELLEARVNYAFDGNRYGPGVVVLTGPSGAGKSSLTVSLAQSLAANGDLVLLMRPGRDCRWIKALHCPGGVFAEARMNARLDDRGARRQGEETELVGASSSIFRWRTLTLEGAEPCRLELKTDGSSRFSGRLLVVIDQAERLLPPAFGAEALPRLEAWCASDELSIDGVKVEVETCHLLVFREDEFLRATRLSRAWGLVSFPAEVSVRVGGLVEEEAQQMLQVLIESGGGRRFPRVDFSGVAEVLPLYVKVAADTALLTGITQPGSDGALAAEMSFRSLVPSYPRLLLSHFGSVSEDSVLVGGALAQECWNESRLDGSGRRSTYAVGEGRLRRNPLVARFSRRRWEKAADLLLNAGVVEVRPPASEPTWEFRHDFFAWAFAEASRHSSERRSQRRVFAWQAVAVAVVAGVPTLSYAVYTRTEVGVLSETVKDLRAKATRLEAAAKRSDERAQEAREEVKKAVNERDAARADAAEAKTELDEVKRRAREDVRRAESARRVADERRNAAEAAKAAADTARAEAEQRRATAERATAAARADAAALDAALRRERSAAQDQARSHARTVERALESAGAARAEAERLARELEECRATDAEAGAGALEQVEPDGGARPPPLESSDAGS